MDKFTRYITDFAAGLVEGATHPKGLLSNWRHATRLFIDDSYRLSPRNKFLFYVKFDIDSRAINAPAFTNKRAEEVGMLVKSSDLPKMNFTSVTKNQYNRKKLLYTDVSYDPITIKLHDDADGVTNALWAQYFGYYCADRMTATSSQAYSATHLHPTNTIFDNYRYGLDNNIARPFFRSVTVYTLCRNRFLGYELINPRIKKWDHGSMDHSATEMLESTLTLEFEAVRYLGGNVTVDNPPGFATLHYDNIPSPLSVSGGGTETLTGYGGVLAGMEQIFGDIATGETDTLGGLISTAIKVNNTINNASNLTGSGIINEITGNLLQAGANNVLGINIPSKSTQSITNATAKRLL